MAYFIIDVLVLLVAFLLKKSINLLIDICKVSRLFVIAR
jgi:hypothetical protein